MRDQKKAEEIALQRVQLLSPLLAEGLDAAQAKQIKASICQQTGISERTLRRYLLQYRTDGFGGLKPKGKGQRRNEDAIPSSILDGFDTQIVSQTGTLKNHHYDYTFGTSLDI